MLFRVIDKNEVPSLVRGFAAHYEVVGPVERNGGFAFDEVGSDPSRLRVDYDTTLLPPKKYLFPPKAELFTYDTVNNEVKDIDIPVVPRVLFGLHSCDINAINRLDAVFMASDFPDPYYRAQREATMIVGIDCTPNDHCFCNLWGTDEVTQGYDLFLHDLGDRYLVSILSVTAAEILAVATSARPASPKDSIDFQEKARAFKNSFSSGPAVYELPILMDAFYNDGLWDELGDRCLSCTACSMVCPTCYCFNMVDKLDAGGRSGARLRLWDSCCSPSFALVAGGHNFLGYLSKYGNTLCTGCGRCERACKAHISPRVVIQGLQHKAVQSDAAAQGEGGRS